jgi:hypothetical protein
MTQPQVVLLNRVEEYCRRSTGASNEWKGADGHRYHFDTDSIEREGDIIWGTVYRHAGNETRCYAEGSLRIGPDGHVFFFHYLPKEAYSDSV